MDVGINLLMHLDQICWRAIRDPRSRIEMAVVSADPTLKAGTAETLSQHGKARTTAKDIHMHPVFHHLVPDGNVSHGFHSASGAKLDHFQAYLAFDRVQL